MEVYTIDDDGYITDIKDVGTDCEIAENDFIGEPPFKLNHHYETGLKRPLTTENIVEKEIQEISSWLEVRKNIPDSAMTPEQVVERNDKYTRLLELLG